MNTKFISSVLTIALKAGQEISKIYSTGDFQVEAKADNSPLTIADRASNEIITNELKKITPEIPILSEEGKDIPYDIRKNWNKFWLVDPLDGTKEFIKKNGEFTVNIAMIENNNSVFGVIYAPEYVSDEEFKYSEISKDVQSLISDFTSKAETSELNFKGTIYFGAIGIGAYKVYFKDKIIVENLGSNKGINSNIIAVGSRSHSSDEEKNILKEYGVDKVISVGSSLKFCMIAENKAQLYYRHGPTMEWDVGAGYAIAEAAGSKIEGLSFNKENLLNGSFLCRR